MDCLRAVFGVVVFVFVITVPHVLGEEKTREKISYFDLPGQALQISLVEFGLQARVTIVADNELLKGQRSSPVIGPLSVEAALRSLLSTTELAYRYDPANKIYLIEKPIAVEPTENPVAPLEVKPELPTVEELLVKSIRLPFRYQTITNSQMLGDVPYFDSSRFINTLPDVLIDDLHPKEMGDLLKYASSVTPGHGLGDSNDDFYIRGFRRHALYVDGYRSSDLTGLKLIPANIERVEILKGPSTLLYGQAEPGGIVNSVRKKPRDERFINAEIGVGSYGRQYLTVDANTPVIDDSLDMRVIVFNETQDESAEISNIHRQLVAPSAVWHLSPETQIWASYEYQWESKELYTDFPVIKFIEEVGGDTITLDDGVKSARPEFSAESNFVSFGLNHYFSDSWQLNAQYFWHDEDRLGVRAAVDNMVNTEVLYDMDEITTNALLYFFSNRLVVPRFLHEGTPETLSTIGELRSIYDEQGFETNNNIKVKLDGTFELNKWVHHLTLGAEWYQQDIFKNYTIEKRNLFRGRVWAGDDFEDDVVNIVMTVIDPDQPLGVLEQQQVRLLYDDVAMFIQDVVELNDKWVLTMGGRYSYLEGEHTDATEWVITPLETYERFSAQLGLVYKVTEDHSLYANYSEALRANYHLDEVGANRAPPELSDQVEFGIKSLLMDGRLQASFGLFEINKYNVGEITFMRPQDGDQVSSLQVNQVIRGMDLDLTVQVSPEFDVLAGVSLIDPKIVSGVNDGNTPLLAAEQTFSLFGHYQFPSKLELSGGMKYVSSRYMDNANLNQIDPYTTFDLSLGSHKLLFNQEVKWQLSVINVLDEEYSVAQFYASAPNPAEGRALTGSIRVDW